MLAVALATLEKSDGAVSDIIGDRVDLSQLTEQPTFPRLVNVLVSDAPDGISHSGETNVYLSRWQIDAYAQDYDTAEALARALYRLFVPLQRHPVADVIITSCRRTSLRMFYESSIDKWRFLVEFEFRYSFYILT